MKIRTSDNEIIMCHCALSEPIVKHLAEDTRLMIEGVPTRTNIKVSDIVVLEHLEDDPPAANSDQTISLYSSQIERNTFKQNKFEPLPFECTYERSDENADLIRRRVDRLLNLAIDHYIEREIPFSLFSRLSALVQLDLEIRAKDAFQTNRDITMNLPSLKLLNIIWNNCSDQPNRPTITVDAPLLRRLSIQSKLPAFAHLRLVKPQTLTSLAVNGLWQLNEIEEFKNLQTFEYRIGGAPPAGKRACQRWLVGEHSSLKNLSTVLVFYLDVNLSDDKAQFGDGVVGQGIPEEYFEHLKNLLFWKRKTVKVFFEFLQLKTTTDLMELKLGTNSQVLGTQLRHFDRLYPGGVNRFEFNFSAAARALREQQGTEEPLPPAFPAGFHRKFSAIHTVKVEPGNGAELPDYQLLSSFLEGCKILKALKLIDCFTESNQIDSQHFLDSLPTKVPNLTSLTLQNRGNADQLPTVHFNFLLGLANLAHFETNHQLEASIIRDLNRLQFAEYFSFKAETVNRKRKRSKAPETTPAIVEFWVYTDRGQKAKKQPSRPRKRYSLSVERLGGREASNFSSLKTCLDRLEKYIAN